MGLVYIHLQKYKKIFILGNVPFYTPVRTQLFAASLLGLRGIVHILIGHSEILYN